MIDFNVVSNMMQLAVQYKCLFDSAAQGILPLGEVIARLERAERDTPVVIFDLAWQAFATPGDPHSYRGYYEHLAIAPAPSNQPCTAEELLRRLNHVVGKKLTGYKGGEFEMTRFTPVWISPVGESSRMGVTRITIGSAFVGLWTSLIE